jgi:alkylhydroperoxidase family enzyme
MAPKPRPDGMPHNVSDELFARLRSHCSDAVIVELARIAALENYRSRFNRGFRVEAQGFYCVLPQADSRQD